MTFVKMVELSYKGILQTLAKIVPTTGASRARLGIRASRSWKLKRVFYLASA